MSRRPVMPLPRPRHERRRRPWWFTPPDPFVLVVVALTLIGIGFIAGWEARPQGPVVLDLEAARAVGPPEGPGDQLNPGLSDIANVTLQRAFDSLSRERTAARLRPPVRPCRVDSDCELNIIGDAP